jgi:diguanylate cyclase
MGQTGELAVIVPLYYMSVGFLLLMGLQAALLSRIGYRSALNRYLAAICLLGAGMQAANAVFYQADSLLQALASVRWALAFGILALIPLIGFTALYTGQPLSRAQHALLSAPLLALVATELSTPLGTRWVSAQLQPPMRMPWGETLTHVTGVPGVANQLFRLILAVVFAWTLACAVRMYREGRRRGALLFGAYLLLQALSTVWGALIDWQVVEGVYLPGFPIVALVVLMSLSMGLDLRDRTVALAQTADSLSAEARLRRAAEGRILRLAFQDELTGLENRAGMLEKLREALERDPSSRSEGALILVDLAGFKTINVALSHDVGDAVLREVAGRIRDASGPDAVVARLGGDDFAVVCAELGPGAEASAALRAEAVLARITGPLQVESRIVDVGACAGIVVFPGDATDELDVLRRAEMALTDAVAAGRSQVRFYHDGLRRAADERIELGRGLRAALAADALELHYQPQLSASGEVIGAEALMRWTHPGHGVISPARFIPIAEETGLIHELGHWALERACARIRTWEASGQPFRGRVSVNVSPWQLLGPDYVDRVLAALDGHGVRADRITLEVTESSFLYQPDEIASRLSRLRSAGVRVALDDFGTGYASLANLRDLPFDELKVDRAFIRQMVPGERNAMVETIVAIGSHMGLEVLAEGVEESFQREQLLEAGCRLFQGYLFSPALPEEAFLAWIRDHAAAVDPVAVPG